MIGKLPENVLEACLETIPIEFSVLDSEDKVLIWNSTKQEFLKGLMLP